jgi:hypothetical protein
MDLEYLKKSIICIDNDSTHLYNYNSAPAVKSLFLNFYLRF